MQPPKSKGKQESALIFPRDTIPEPIGARFSTVAKKRNYVQKFKILYTIIKMLYRPSFLRDVDQQTSHSLGEANEKLVSVSQKETFKQRVSSLNTRLYLSTLSYIRLEIKTFRCGSRIGDVFSDM